MAICGRCGNPLYFAGSDSDLDWWGCEKCRNYFAEQDTEYNHCVEAKTYSKLNKRKKKWFASG